MVCNKLFLTHVILWTRLHVSFNAYVDPLYEFQVIYRALTRQLAQEDTLLLLNDQSGSVLGDSTVFPGRVVTIGIRAIICTRD
jgi:hypothetical protein